MLTMVLLAVAVTAQDASQRHVRAPEPRILALIEAGISRSATFRSLVASLDRSDVIVYIEPKTTRENLGAYLAHQIISRGGYRYLQIAVPILGSETRLVTLIAHELQHAVEVAQAPDAIDSASMEQLFDRLAVRFGCDGSTCSETQAAKDVEHAVGEELKGARRYARK